VLLDIRGDGRIREINDHVALALGAALEIDAANRPASLRGWSGRCRSGRGGTRCHGSRARRSRGGALTDHHKQIIALDPRAVRRQLRQADNQPRAILGFGHRGRARVAAAQIKIPVGHLAGHARQIQCNACR